jgi:hypothetical protein
MFILLIEKILNLALHVYCLFFYYLHRYCIKLPDMPCVTAQNGKRPDTKSDMHTMKMAENIADPKCRPKKVKKLSDLPNVSDDYMGYIVFYHWI